MYYIRKIVEFVILALMSGGIGLAMLIAVAMS